MYQIFVALSGCVVSDFWWPSSGQASPRQNTIEDHKLWWCSPHRPLWIDSWCVNWKTPASTPTPAFYLHWCTSGAAFDPTVGVSQSCINFQKWQPLISSTHSLFITTRTPPKSCWLRIYDHPADSLDNKKFTDPIATIDSARTAALKKEQAHIELPNIMSRWWQTGLDEEEWTNLIA